jgi:hypothetical protein
VDCACEGVTGEGRCEGEYVERGGTWVWLLAGGRGVSEGVLWDCLGVLARGRGVGVNKVYCFGWVRKCR